MSLLIFLSTFALLLFCSPALVFAQDPAPLSALNSVFGTLLSSVITLVGAASLIMLLAGGFQYFSAGGDKEGAARAQRTLTYAVIGLILTASAYMILSLLGTFLGANLTLFDICIVAGC